MISTSVLLTALISLISLSNFADCLDNGVARTPPMGWMSWQQYKCNIDEKLFTRMADAMVSEGYKDVGYEYIDIDDCWMDRTRDSNGKLRADPKKFPHGIKWLADYVHAKGLKLGIYSDIGNYTCQKYPGSGGDVELDAKTFAEWGVDALKLDGCYANKQDYIWGYPAMSKALNATGRPIGFSCSWPAYLNDEEKSKWYPTIQKNCNSWRNWADINGKWSSLSSIIEYWGKHNTELARYAEPGAWNDPDQILIGEDGFGADQTESETQFAIWAMLAAPLHMSNDLGTLKSWQKELMQNKEIIAVNQDPLGKQGTRIQNSSTKEVWARELKGNTKALVFYNKSGSSVTESFNVGKYAGDWRDVINHKDLGHISGTYTATIPSHGVVMVTIK